MEVSIIIPIYQSERYLHRCLTSVVNQTFSNFELLLVNDGSTDGSSRIMNEWRKKDDRIVVIEQDNVGAYAARNKGLQLVRSPFVMFIDSDDWIEETMIEELISLMKEHQADIVQSHFYYADDERLTLDQRYINKQEVMILSNVEAMKELVVNERVKNFTWGKLLKTSLAKKVPFKEGVKFEDVFWAHQLMKHVDRFVLSSKPLYYYYQREDSLVHAYTLENLNMINGLKERQALLERYYPTLLPESYKLMLTTIFSHYRLLYIHRRSLDPNGVERKKLYTFVKQSKREIANAVGGNRDLLISFHLFCVHPFLLFAYLLCKKGLRTLRIIRVPESLKIFHSVKEKNYIPNEER
ncbi:glycosyltransferase family 2 protein [Halalkalibacter sp. APA_J-10(15)]|uniref:glycosyltransferase family 2 protein n=1 Tax=Halalkalibacter sp. APA_J-10(15) TaxID=2933805 RepID=UPI001FF2D21F|nr:glycosyltransferase family 2 protein [Halalkalibacter sp. APA_J-10(15)]MCK0470347.1 glycosyltransferase family 2 protein [Halalkalibacter sp. APA_J-10(15)]